MKLSSSDVHGAQICGSEEEGFVLPPQNMVWSEIWVHLLGNLLRAGRILVRGFDLILGMGWLSVNGASASIDFRPRTLSVKPSGRDPFIFFAPQGSNVLHVISFVCVRKLLQKGCQGFFASVVAVSEPPTRSMAKLEVVRDFPDVFSNDVAGIPPGIEVEFSIKLMPDSVPISKAL
ncbi:uncharacterized protein [Henckelia pumila]|uniref:uncharacterized protein n=1 Tax=Henckelia pumila TaxID=405737 RepID=UPI003C6DFEE6